MAQWFNMLGVATFVLKYRVGPRYHYPARFQDAHRALRYVRTKAGEFGRRRSDRYHRFLCRRPSGFDRDNPFRCRQSRRRRSDRARELAPGFSDSRLPGDLLHQRVHASRFPLHGARAESRSQLMRSLSNELQVTAQTPPTFLFHMADDKVS